MAVRKVYKVRVKTTSGEYEGTFFSPHPERRLAEVINRLEGYLTLSHVAALPGREAFPFIVINKNNIETIILLGEKELAAHEMTEIEH